MSPAPLKSRPATKRKYRRFPVNQPAMVSCATVPGLVWVARIVEVSRRGMQLILKQPALIDADVRIQCASREIYGTVRHQYQRGGEYRVGVALAHRNDSLLVEVLAREMLALRRMDEEVAASAALLRHQIREITAALEEATRASALKSRFLAGVSHEFRTPLNGIIGFSELLYDARVGPVNLEQKEYLSDILSCSRHLLTLINQVLDLTKIESGKMAFAYEALDVGELVKEVKNGVKAMAAKKSIALRAECDPCLGIVRADAARLRQVLFNYLSNALKFTPEGGTVTVLIRPEEPACYRIVVEDSGIGIRESDLGKLFTEFGQLGSPRVPGSGTGLGLAITRQIVEKQGGRVGVESTWGAGSRFWAVLPVDPEAA